MKYPRPVKSEVDHTVRAIAHASTEVGWMIDIYSVARSGRSVYLRVTNGNHVFRLRVSDHPSRYYKVTTKARQVLTTRPGTLTAMLRWFRSRGAKASAGEEACVARPNPRASS